MSHIGAGRSGRPHISTPSALHDALARLPQTLCHVDAGHHNLLPQPDTDGDGRTVPIDWERIGIVAVGEEIGLIVSTPFLRHRLDPATHPLVQESVFEGYLADEARDLIAGGRLRDPL